MQRCLKVIAYMVWVVVAGGKQRERLRRDVTSSEGVPMSVDYCDVFSFLVSVKRAVEYGEDERTGLDVRIRRGVRTQTTKGGGTEMTDSEQGEMGVL